MDSGEAGKVAVITGATGGIGAAVAKVLSKAGYSLVLTAPSMEKLTGLASQLAGPCTVVAGNLSDETLAETLLNAALDRFGRCDVCLNNGALFEAGLIETIEIDRLCNMVCVNVEGAFRAAYVFMKHFVLEESGHLVNISSGVGSRERPTAYAATQHAIEILSDALATEVAGTDVYVSCIQPGLAKTGLDDRWELLPARPTSAAGTGSEEPLEPEDFARMVLFILEQAGKSKGSSDDVAIEVTPDSPGLA
jgi:NADP-dependent 3-hydroxy acid dehydrogenase YdfG